MKMDERNNTNRRTVLKTLGAGFAGGTLGAGSAAAHGGDQREEAWLLDDVWEMADRPPSGEEPTDDSSHVPIYYIAPGAKPAEGYDCAQVTLDFGKWETHPETKETFKNGKWGEVPVDQTLHDIPPPEVEFTTLWHEQFVFDKKTFDNKSGKDLVPADLVNTDHEGDPLTNSGRRILKATNVEVVSVPFVFNCPARPAQGDHLNYCD